MKHDKEQTGYSVHYTGQFVNTVVVVVDVGLIEKNHALRSLGCFHIDAMHEGSFQSSLIAESDLGSKEPVVLKYTLRTDPQFQ